MAKIQREVFVPESLAYKRLDHIAAILLPEYSRNRIQFWIKSGALIVNEQSRRASDKLIGGERICLDVTLENLEAQPEEIDCDQLKRDGERCGPRIGMCTTCCGATSTCGSGDGYCGEGNQPSMG